MKIRNGFVSNSSSSSFVIAIGKVKSGKSPDIVELAKKHNCNWDAEIAVYEGGTIRVEDFMCGDLSLNESTLKEGDNVLKFEAYGNEGDDYFMDGDDSWGPEYGSFDYEDLPESTQDFLSDVQELIDGDLDISYGAGRNG